MHQGCKVAGASLEGRATVQVRKPDAGLQKEKGRRYLFFLVLLQEANEAGCGCHATWGRSNAICWMRESPGAIPRHHCGSCLDSEIRHQAVCRLAASLALAEDSAASKYIIAEMERLDVELGALKREASLAEMESHRAAASAKDAKATAAEIAKLIHGLEGFDDKEKKRDRSRCNSGVYLGRGAAFYYALNLTNGGICPQYKK